MSKSVDTSEMFDDHYHQYASQISKTASKIANKKHIF